MDTPLSPKENAAAIALVERINELIKNQPAAVIFPALTCVLIAEEFARRQEPEKLNTAIRETRARIPQARAEFFAQLALRN